MLGDSRPMPRATEARALSEQVIEAQRLLESIDSALAGDTQAWLSDTDRASLAAAMAGLRDALRSEDADRIRRCAVALNELSMPFAARRMDEAVRRALAGRQIADVS